MTTIKLLNRYQTSFSRENEDKSTLRYAVLVLLYMFSSSILADTDTTLIYRVLHIDRVLFAKSDTPEYYLDSTLIDFIEFSGAKTVPQSYIIDRSSKPVKLTIQLELEREAKIIPKDTLGFNNICLWIKYNQGATARKVNLTPTLVKGAKDTLLIKFLRSSINLTNLRGRAIFPKDEFQLFFSTSKSDQQCPVLLNIVLKNPDEHSGFKLSDTSLVAMRQDQMPGRVINKLERTKNRVFTSKEKLNDHLQEVLGENDWLQYGRLIRQKYAQPQYKFNLLGQHITENDDTLTIRNILYQIEGRKQYISSPIYAPKKELILINAKQNGLFGTARYKWTPSSSKRILASNPANTIYIKRTWHHTRAWQRIFHAPAALYALAMILRNTSEDYRIKEGWEKQLLFYSGTSLFALPFLNRVIKIPLLSRIIGNGDKFDNLIASLFIGYIAYDAKCGNHIFCSDRMRFFDLVETHRPIPFPPGNNRNAFKNNFFRLNLSLRL